jgi:hypothetical protein
MEDVIFDISEKNQIDFAILVEGAQASHSNARLVCECDDVMYSFQGRTTKEPNVVEFDIPRMDTRLKEGKYNCKVEVFVENRYFTPVEFVAEFKKTVKVVAEAIVNQKVSKNDVSVVASVIRKKLANIDKKISR